MAFCLAIPGCSDELPDDLVYGPHCMGTFDLTIDPATDELPPGQYLFAATVEDTTLQWQCVLPLDPAAEGRCPDTTAVTQEGEQPVYVLQWRVDRADNQLHFLTTDPGKGDSNELSGPDSVDIAVLRDAEEVHRETIAPQYELVAENNKYACYFAEATIDLAP